MKINKQEALELATKYKIDKPHTYHSINYVAKKIYQHQTYKWFEADNPSNKLKENK